MTGPFILRRAAAADEDAVWSLLHETITWLRSRQLDQWSTWQGWTGPTGKVRKALDAGHVWLLSSAASAGPIGTITIEPVGDADFWSPQELSDSAVYVSKLAVRRDHAGQELGDLLLAWARDFAFREGYDLVRLDAWRTNPRLHQYYVQRGWRLIREQATPGRQSGVLFELPSCELSPERGSRISQL